ncbi:MAG: recombinase family protein [Lachnospiraceae bacterium]|nr:recombinase family protein [Lachnospiraceae bacterium]
MNILEPVVGYVRVSTLEQAQEGYSIHEQAEKLNAYCKAMGWNLVNIYSDPGFSGATLDRPGIKKVIKDVQAGRCKKVIVWKLDRLSRSQKDTLILLEDVFLANDCNFVSIMESFDTSTPFGRCIVGILAAFAQMERENIKIRTSMGRHARIRQGYFHGSHAPVGYKFAEKSNDLIIDPYYSKIVREVFQLYISGRSIKSIGVEIKNKYGDKRYDWGNNTAVRRILSNPIYMGRVTLGDQIYEGLHEPIVSETDWYLAAAILEHNKTMDKRTYAFKASGATADNLLTGLLFCGYCGARMYARKVSKVKKKYICHSVARTSAAMIKSDNCTNRVHPYTVEQLDAIVIEEIKKLSLDRSYFDSMVDQMKEEAPDELAAFQERLEEVEKQIERLLNLYQSGIMELEELQGRLSDLKEEREKLQANIESLEAVPPPVTLDTAWSDITSLYSVMESGNAEEVHRIIHVLVDKVVVLNYDVTIYWSFC